jgi:hypothetical protein
MYKGKGDSTNLKNYRGIVYKINAHVS